MSEQKAAREAAWKNSIFAKDKFSKDLRRSNTVRGIFDVGFDAGYAAGQGQWIPTQSGYSNPKENGVYLVTMKTGTVTKLTYNDVWMTWGEKQNVIAWRPLPAPYVEEPGEVKNEK